MKIREPKNEQNFKDATGKTSSALRLRQMGSSPYGSAGGRCETVEKQLTVLPKCEINFTVLLPLIAVYLCQNKQSFMLNQ